MKGIVSKIVHLIHEYVDNHQADYERYDSLQMNPIEQDNFEKSIIYHVMQEMKGRINPRTVQELVEMEMGTQI